MATIRFIDQFVSLPVAQVPADRTITVKGFDPALGTLFQVDVAVQPEGTMTVNFINQNTFTDPGGNGFGDVAVDLKTPSGAGFAFGDIEFFLGVRPLDPGASATTTFDSQGPAAGDMRGSILSSQVLAEFVSSGNVFLPVSFGPGSMRSPFTDDVATVELASMGLSLDLTYEYTPTPVPEPSSAVLLISVIVVVGLSLLRPQRSLTRSSTPGRLP